MSHTTIGLFKTTAAAEGAINDLKEMGIDESNISYIYVTGEGNTVANDANDEIITNNDSAGGTIGSGAAGGAATGAVIGAIAGLVVANGILPGVGTLFVAGPLAASLGLTGAAATTAAGALTGVAAGGIIGALSNIGLSDDEAKVYDDRIKSGDVLVATTAEADVKSVFERNGAEEMKEYTK